MKTNKIFLLKKIILMILLIFLPLIYTNKNNTDYLNNKKQSINTLTNFYNSLNFIFSFFSAIYSFILFVIDVFSIPYYIILILNDIGTFKLIQFILTQTFSFIVLKLFPILPIKIFSLVSQILIVIKQTGIIFYYLIYNFPSFIYFLFSPIKYLTQFNYNKNNSKENLSYSFSAFFFDNLNPFGLFDKRHFFGILLFLIQILLMFNLIKFIYSVFRNPLNYISRFKFLFTNIIFNNNNNNNSIFNVNFTFEEIRQENCAICIEDFILSRNHPIIKFNRIKQKINELLSTSLDNFKNSFFQKFNTTNKLIELECTHCFHGKCIGDLISHYQKRSKCPICRHDLQI